MRDGLAATRSLEEGAQNCNSYAAEHGQGNIISVYFKMGGIHHAARAPAAHRASSLQPWLVKRKTRGEEV